MVSQELLLEVQDMVILHLLKVLHCIVHYLKLSLQFHLDRQTGGTSRSIDRGAKAMTLLLSTGIFEVVPLIVELFFICGVLWVLFGYEFAVITFLTVVTYSYFTIKTTEWRIKFRRRMNEADEYAATKTVDSVSYTHLTLPTSDLV
mgnify:CR=1 FL=1